MLHVISARCVANDLYTTEPGPLERTWWRRFAAQCGDCKNLELRLWMRLLSLLFFREVAGSRFAILRRSQLLSFSGQRIQGTLSRQLLTKVWFVCLFVGWLVGCLTSQQHASVSQGRICSDNFTCCHTEIEVADQTFYLTQSQYTDTGPTSPITDPMTPGAWQGSHWSANF